MDQPAAAARPSDFVQALFDLGATICTPRRPACVLCPWREECGAQRLGIQAALPAKAARLARAERHGLHFAARHADGRLLLRHRPPTGLLGGMLEFPGTPWRDTPWTIEEALSHAPLPDRQWILQTGLARHGFTHMALTMRLAVADGVVAPLPEGADWFAPDAAAAALPTAMRRLLALLPPAPAALGMAVGVDAPAPPVPPVAARARHARGRSAVP